ncbi:uncharacterized protein DEA37_0003356 [Paragonimus westermani]|uniref:Reverse transcriptase domain-containing protein n=1 Tax=Paragonimus westermani TaxID=34504 RepID=A0A5J4NDY2_9TREM|nr:uncharacterized protein DEA37_0003356 [Paragonimus westermani]
MVTPKRRRDYVYMTAKSLTTEQAGSQNGSEIHTGSNNLFSFTQHGFIPNRSCVTNMLIFMDSLTEAKYNGLISDSTSFDFAKAFDRIPHGPLKHELEAYGIQGEVLSWIASFLDNRTFRVNTGSDLPSPSFISAGVPQGSVLGPSNVLLYADDLKVCNSTDPTALQIDLDAIESWSDDWSLPLNDNNCVHMSLGGDSDNAFMIHSASDTVDIMRIDLKKDMRIWLSSNLSVTYHHEMAAKRGFAALMMIKRTFPRMDKKAFQTHYGIFIRPLLEYANQVVYNGLKREILAVERVQRAATKMVAGLSNVTYKSRLEILDLYPLEFRRLRGDLILTHFFSRGGLAEQFFTVANDDGRRGHNRKVFKRRPRTFLRQQFFSCRVINYWNSLPSEVVSSASMDRFKALLDSHSTQIALCE